MTSAPDPRSAALDAIAARVRAALSEDVRSGEVPAEQPDPGFFTGRAADGQVSAEVAADGTLRRLTLEPRVFDRPLVDIAAAARVAINEALDARPGRVDSGPIIAALRATQDEARRGLRAVTQGMADVEQRVRSERGGDR